MIDTYCILISPTGANCCTVSEYVQTCWQQNFVHRPEPVLHVGATVLV
jgi:hypothetical protein